jgi:tetratricopeptide (TPR) repeat protein
LETLLQNAQRQFFDGEVAAAIETLGQLKSRAWHDHALLQSIAGAYLKCGQHSSSDECYARSVELQPSNPDYLYNLATSRIAMGNIGEAESLFTRAIKLNPADYGAWLNRSGLRKQTAESNHVEQLKFVKAHLTDDDEGQVPVCFALAKELEDLGRHDESFAYLQEGAHRRRLGMQYDVSEDERAMAEIASVFSADRFSQVNTQPAERHPIFILGLPRSGTTLVDRIVSSHSRVDSLGEHSTLPLALMKMGGQTFGESTDKLDLIGRSADFDFQELGDRYLRGIEGFGNRAERLIDKTPQNFLYLGLIRLSMPGARVIHLRRKPMDVCYAIYKTLFRAGYPFSYSLQETGRYYIAYHRLMAHWRSVIPGAFLDVDYEKLVGDQEGETRRILEYLELDWEDGCLDFHRHSGPAATASAAQVRQPIYSSSVDLWRKYEKQLTPFADRLREHGIEVD